jgi:5'-deoxynucleotidase YfbR-like HD superfamily hydrolase
MPNLQEHQLRVAAVARQLCDAMKVPVDTNAVVTACLVHDMGNIIKFDLSYFPEFVQEKGLAYWQEVKEEYVRKYGNNEHIATEKIAEELDISEVSRSYLPAIGFTRSSDVLARGSLEQKVCLYADQRVGAYGVVSLHDRLIEGKKRYKGRADKALSLEEFEKLFAALVHVEKELFARSSIHPDDITDESVGVIIEELRNAVI